MPDEVTPGELDRRLRGHETRTDRIHAELDNRLTRVAADMVPLGTFQAAQDAHRETVARMEREHAQAIRRLEREHEQDTAEMRSEIRELRERPAMSAGRWAVIVTAAVAMLALLVQAYGTLKGAK